MQNSKSHLGFTFAKNLRAWSVDADSQRTKLGNGNGGGGRFIWGERILMGQNDEDAGSRGTEDFDAFERLPWSCMAKKLSRECFRTEIPTAGAATDVPDDGKPYQLKLTNLHTGENLDIVYRVGNTYIPEALEKLNYFLRDHNTQDVSNYDPKEFDVLHAMMSRLGKLNGVIEVVCGYRTPETNAALRQGSPQTGVAEHSQHMEGHAIDLRVLGVATAKLRDAALSLRAGGVGYYPVSQFVHVDVGPVREWVFGPKQRRIAARRVHSNRSSGM